MSSIPAKVTAADQKDLNPSIGRTWRLIARWSCSTTLLSPLISGSRSTSGEPGGTRTHGLRLKVIRSVANQDGCMPPQPLKPTLSMRKRRECSAFGPPNWGSSRDHHAVSRPGRNGSTVVPAHRECITAAACLPISMRRADELAMRLGDEPDPILHCAVGRWLASIGLPPTGGARAAT
jgi:hypothetical protein